MIKDMNFWIQEAQYIVNTVKKQNLDLSHHWKAANMVLYGERLSFSIEIWNKTRMPIITRATQHYLGSSSQRN